MTNHIHLVVEPGKDAMGISTMMKRVNGRQTAYVNKLEGRSGALWEGRYKASPIQKTFIYSPVAAMSNSIRLKLAWWRALLIIPGRVIRNVLWVE
ncbi:MAG: transposase [Pseudomonadales bacterium]|jgi:REP element-mobilizing transposase RayT